MNQIITTDAAFWGLIIGTVLPMLVGIVTKSSTPSRIKAVLLAALAAAVAVGDEIAQEGSFEVKETVIKFALLFFTAVGAHFGLLKPTNVTGAGSATAQIGPK